MESSAKGIEPMAAVASNVHIVEGDLENHVLRLFRAYKKEFKNGLIPKGSTRVEKSNDLKSATHKDIFVASDGSPSPSAYASYELLLTSFKEANRAARHGFSFVGKPNILKAFAALMGSDINKFTEKIFPEEASHEELGYIKENLVDKVEALFLEVKEIVRRETGFEGSQPKVSDFVAITLKRDDKPTLFVFAHAVLCLIIGYFAVEEMMVPDNSSVDAAVAPAPVISSAGDTAAPDNSSVDAAAAPVISSAGDTAAPDNSSVDAAAAPVIPSAGDTVAPDNSSVDAAVAPEILVAKVQAGNHSKPFCYDLYLYVAYKCRLIQEADYLALRSRRIRHHFTENIGKSVILLSYAYRSKIQENLVGALSLINVNLPEHNAVKYIKDFVSRFSTDDPSSVYEYMVLLGFISEVTLEICRRNKETDPHEGYLNTACKYFRECGMLNFEEMLRRDGYITLHDLANLLAKSWEPMRVLVEGSQQSLRIPSNEELKLVASHLPNETSNDRDSSEGLKFEGGAFEGRSGPEGQEEESLDEVAKCPKEEESASGEGALSELKNEGVTKQPASKEEDEESHKPREDCPASEEEDDEYCKPGEEGPASKEEDEESRKPREDCPASEEEDDECCKPGEEGPASKEEDDESGELEGAAVGSEERLNPEGKEDASCWKPKPKGKKSKNKKQKGRR